MPAAGMRRTTRVFGVVQGADGARVLRSGRRLWPDLNHFNFRKESDEIECSQSADEAPQAVPLSDPSAQPPVSDGVSTGQLDTDCQVYRESDANYDAKMFGIVYSRKRKRHHVGQDSLSFCDDSRMYGTYYVRRRSKKDRFATVNDYIHQSRLLVITFRGLQSNLHLLATCFSSILTYMWNTSARLRKVFNFLSYRPIAMAFASAGICFWQEPCKDASKCCTIYSTAGRRLLFSVNFSSLPVCFLHMHSAMLLEAEHLLVHTESAYLNVEMLEEIIHTNLLDSSILEAPVSELVSTLRSTPSLYIDNHQEVHWKTLPRSTFHTVRKKRTLRRSKMAQNISLFFSQRSKSNRGRSISEFFTVRKRSPHSFMFGNQFYRKPASANLDVRTKELESLKSGLRQHAPLSSCSANLLVVQPDNCYREEGAHIVLEQYPTKEWFLVVKKNGHVRCCHKAEKVMMPCSSNHVTHGIVWAVADTLKLEFPNESDWEAFKELYNECAERNKAASTAKFIPVPRVLEVSYDNEHNDLFSRPEAYIRQIGDDISQALTRRTSNYDMDSEDEEWLNKFNNVPTRETSTAENVTDETFELIIDSLEKASYFMAINAASGELPANLCSELCSREVLEAVHCYWVDKRKKKKRGLVRVFQVHQPLKDPYDQDNFQHRRKQSKRSAGQSTKSKQQRTEASSMKGVSMRTTTKESDIMSQVETAKAIAGRYTDLAIKKRSIAQILMVNADLMMYKAKMSMKIADEAKHPGSFELTDSTDFPSQCSNSRQQIKQQSQHINAGSF